jgi:hypothetical protein
MSCLSARSVSAEKRKNPGNPLANTRGMQTFDLRLDFFKFQDTTREIPWPFQKQLSVGPAQTTSQFAVLPIFSETLQVDVISNKSETARTLKIKHGGLGDLPTLLF